MTWLQYAENNRIDAIISIQQQGFYPFTQIFLNAVIYNPQYLNLQIEFYEHFLPYSYFQFYLVNDSSEIVWVCKYCRFWCEVFDQTLMELHVCTVCSQVNMVVYYNI